MNNIQKLIYELEDDMKQAEEKCNKYMIEKKDADYWKNYGIWTACFLHITKLRLLLKEETAKDLLWRWESGAL